MPTMQKSVLLFVIFLLSLSSIFSQTIPVPNILEIKNDDRVATVYYNSKTATYHPQYDPDKQDGIFSYLVEWGKVADGFTESAVTPYRVYMMQPLEVSVPYQVRVYALDATGKKSAPSETIQFQHDDTRVEAMRTRLNGFFDDMNLPMGAFDETKWNQSYSGCMNVGKTSQHINNQFHGHNVIASGDCDRGVASSRLRQTFDFTNRTGTIEFDLDGSKLGRQFWYLDLTPADKKRDLTGHTSLEVNDNPPQSDPAYLLRFVERGEQVLVQLADEQGQLYSLDNMYQNDACGDLLEYCDEENLIPIPNIRRHWKIELSKTQVKVFINDILVLDGSLITDFTPNGLPYEIAQINWLFFSYNTGKENIPLAMVHWDNFGIDAPTNFAPSNIVHNYTDGILGTATLPVGNEGSAGQVATLTTPAVTTIPIPDPIRDQQNNWPLQTELLFTLQGNDYEWTANDYVVVNGQHYSFPEPSSSIPSFPEDLLIETNKPHSAILDIDPADLIQGDNDIQFFLNDARLLNIHIELTYPVADAPTFTPPAAIFPNYMQTLMAFKGHTNIGPGITLNEMDNIPLWQGEFVKETDLVNGQLIKYIKQTPVSETIELDITGNSNAQLASTGHAKGIAYYEIWIDQQVVETIRVDDETAVAYFQHEQVLLDTRNFSNGEHELYIQAYDVNGQVSTFDMFQAHAAPGEYIPVVFTIENTSLVLDWNSFEAFKQGNQVELDWKIAPAVEHIDFEVQRSPNGQAWKKLGLVTASTNKTAFHFTDEQPYLGENYYRIKLISIAKEVMFSSVRRVIFEEGSIRIYPNPVVDLLHVAWNEDQQLTTPILIYDIMGRIVKKFDTKAAISSTITLDLKNIPQGLYFIQIETNQQKLISKMNKL